MRRLMSSTCLPTRTSVRLTVQLTMRPMMHGSAYLTVWLPVCLSARLLTHPPAYDGSRSYGCPLPLVPLSVLCGPAMRGRRGESVRCHPTPSPYRSPSPSRNTRLRTDRPMSTFFRSSTTPLRKTVLGAGLQSTFLRKGPAGRGKPYSRGAPEYVPPHEAQSAAETVCRRSAASAVPRTTAYEMTPVFYPKCLCSHGCA